MLICVSVIFLLSLSRIPLYSHTYPYEFAILNHSFVDGHLGSGQFGTIINKLPINIHVKLIKAAMNICIKLLLWVYAFIFLDIQV